MNWRVINTDLADPFYVTAADEALCQLRTKEMIPNTLHFYRRNRPTISIGRSRMIQNDVNLEFCRKNQIQLIRRITGGGTIYTDPGCLIYSLVFDHTKYHFQKKYNIFTTICTALQHALTQFNLQTIYKPPNDILVNNKKISGSGIIHKRSITLIHGTILVRTQLTLMQKALKLPKNPPITTLQNETTLPISYQLIQQAVQHAFQQVFTAVFEPDIFTSQEKTLITKLVQTRYTQHNWTYQR